MSEDEDSIASASSDALGIESSATSFSARGDLRPPPPAPFVPDDVEAQDRGQDSGSETEPTSRAVPTPPDEADNEHNERIIAKLKKEVSALIARFRPKNEEDVQKIARALSECQGQLFSIRIRKPKE